MPLQEVLALSSGIPSRAAVGEGSEMCLTELDGAWLLEGIHCSPICCLQCSEQGGSGVSRQEKENHMVFGWQNPLAQTSLTRGTWLIWKVVRRSVTLGCHTSVGLSQETAERDWEGKNCRNPLNKGSESSPEL